MAHYLYKVCETCGGDGVAELSGQPYNSVPCWHCDGSGEVVVGELPEVAEDLETIVPVVTSDLPATKEGVDEVKADVAVVKADVAVVKVDLTAFRSDLQDYLVAWKAEETDAFTTVIQKLNQILAALP